MKKQLKYFTGIATALVFLIGSNSAMAGGDEENYNTAVTVDGIKIKLQLTDEKNAAKVKMKDKSSVDANWASATDSEGYRFYYVRDQEKTHKNCNRVESDGTIFPGEYPDGSYLKNTLYKLKGTGGNTVKVDGTDAGSFTVCAVYVYSNGSFGEYIFVGSMWLSSNQNNELKKIKIVDK